MSPTQLLSDTVKWAGKNIAYNLGKIPDDKLGWKPAPDAKSALEISAEVVGVLLHFTATLNKQESGERPVFTSGQEAQEAVEKASADYALLLLSLGDNDLIGEMDMGFAKMPKSRVVAMPVVEALHHHGQIAYIQTLLGDTESHFYEMGN